MCLAQNCYDTVALLCEVLRATIVWHLASFRSFRIAVIFGYIRASNPNPA